MLQGLTSGPAHSDLLTLREGQATTLQVTTRRSTDESSTSCAADPNTHPDDLTGVRTGGTETAVGSAADRDLPGPGLLGLGYPHGTVNLVADVGVRGSLGQDGMAVVPWLGGC